MTKKGAIHALATPVRPDVALRESAEALATVCKMIDEGDVDPRHATVRVVFDEAKGGLALSVDSAIQFKRQLEAEAAHMQRVSEHYKGLQKRAETMVQAFDEKLITCMTAHPDLPWRGELEGFKVKNNPVSVEFEWGEQRLTEKIIDDYAIPLEFVRPKVSYEIDKTAVKKALDEGREIKWARLRNKKRVETE